MSQINWSKQTRRVAQAISLFAGLLLSVNSFAALNAYLTLEGAIQGDIEGSVTQAGREGSIMVIGYSHNNGVSKSWRKCPSSVAHEPLHITKEVDASTPALYQAFTDKELMTTFILRFWRPSQSGQEEQFYTIELVNARIVGINQEMLNNKYPENMQHKEREHVSFEYEQIIRTYEAGDSPSSSSDSWSQKCGRW
jgi:type VI secretion system secreted protein Hcp